MHDPLQGIALFCPCAQTIMTTSSATVLRAQTIQYASTTVTAAGSLIVTNQAILNNTTLSGAVDFTGAREILGLENYSTGVQGVSLGSGIDILASFTPPANMTFRNIVLSPPLSILSSQQSILEVTFASNTVLSSLASSGTLIAESLGVTTSTSCASLSIPDPNLDTTVDATQVTGFSPALSIGQVWTALNKGDLLTFSTGNQNALTHPGPTVSNLVLSASSTSPTGLEWASATSLAPVSNIDQRFPLTAANYLLIVGAGSTLSTLAPVPGPTSGPAPSTGLYTRVPYLQTNPVAVQGIQWQDPGDSGASVLATGTLQSNATGAAVVGFAAGAAFSNVPGITAQSTVALASSAVSGASNVALNASATTLTPYSSVGRSVPIVGTAPTLSVDFGEPVALGQTFRMGGPDLITPIYTCLTANPVILQSTWSFQQVVCAATSNILAGQVVAATLGMTIPSSQRIVASDSAGTFQYVTFTLSLDGSTGVALDTFFPARDQALVSGASIPTNAQALVPLQFVDNTRSLIAFNTGVLTWVYNAPQPTQFTLRWVNPSDSTTATTYMLPTSFTMD